VSSRPARVARFECGCCDEIHHCLVAHERCPLQFMLMKENRRCSILFHFWSRENMADRDRDSDRVRKCLQMKLPTRERLPLLLPHRHRSAGVSPWDNSFCPSSATALDTGHGKLRRIVCNPTLTRAWSRPHHRFRREPPCPGQLGKSCVRTRGACPDRRQVRPGLRKAQSALFLVSTEITDPHSAGTISLAG